MLKAEGSVAVASFANFTAAALLQRTRFKAPLDGDVEATKVVVFYRLTGKITGKTVLPVCW